MNASRLWLLGLAFAATTVAAGGWLTQPEPLAPPRARVPVGDDPAAFLARTEAEVARRSGIVEGAEKRIRWANDPGVRTPFVVVYLHGFSATRQEIAPVPARLADALGANLFETRLAGHGLERGPLTGVAAEDWLADGAEALAIAGTLGNRIVLIGTSTGATLAVAMARHPDFKRVDSLVLISPNWGPAAAGAGIATGPWGRQLTLLLAGSERQWEPANDDQGRYWTTRYPSLAIVEMMRLVDLADRLTDEARVPSALLVYSPQDDVVSVPKLLDGFARLPAQRKATIAVDAREALSAHVFTGDILAPEQTPLTVAAVLDFITAETAGVPAKEGPTN